MLLGGDDFVARFSGSASSAEASELREVPRAQRRVLAPSLKQFASQYDTRNESMAAAYRSGAYTM